MNIVVGDIIRLTKGDTMDLDVTIKSVAGEEYTPSSGDIITFGLRRDDDDEKYLLTKDIPVETMVLHFSPGDTEKLSTRLNHGKYIYDVQLTKSDGARATVVPNGVLILSREVVR